MLERESKMVEGDRVRLSEATGTVLRTYATPTEAGGTRTSVEVRWDTTATSAVPIEWLTPLDAGEHRSTARETAARSERRRTQRSAERRQRAKRERTVRRCKCGCGKKIPPEADPRRKFYDDGHRIAHNNRTR